MNPLARHYSRFRVTERILLTGHSHQAWPDVGFEAQQQAWLDAANFVDEKWERAAAEAAQVRAGFARLLGDSAANVALGQNTHELVTRWLSALPLRERRRIVTTDAEFHTIRRQLDRLAEDALLQIVRVRARPVDTLSERLAATTDDSTAAVLVSSVLFDTAEIVPGLPVIARRCAEVGAELLVDAYHHLNVVPFDLSALDLRQAFVTGGGYKYCQLGEGNAFLRVPPERRMRPVLTGWFAEFAALEEHSAPEVRYGNGAAAFAGATYDPTSNYRAAAVFRFHVGAALTPERLRDISRSQVGCLKEAVERLDLDERLVRVEPMPDARRAGFLALRTPAAVAIVRGLRAHGVMADARGDVVRLGPAPYLDESQLREAVTVLGEVVKGFGPRGV